MAPANSVTSSYGLKGWPEWGWLRSGPFHCVLMLAVCVDLCSDEMKTRLHFRLMWKATSKQWTRCEHCFAPVLPSEMITIQVKDPEQKRQTNINMRFDTCASRMHVQTNTLKTCNPETVLNSSKHWKSLSVMHEHKMMHDHKHDITWWCIKHEINIRVIETLKMMVHKMMHEHKH